MRTKKEYKYSCECFSPFLKEKPKVQSLGIKYTNTIILSQKNLWNKNNKYSGYTHLVIKKCINVMATSPEEKQTWCIKIM